MVPGPYNDQSEDRVQARERWWTDNFRDTGDKGLFTCWAHAEYIVGTGNK